MRRIKILSITLIALLAFVLLTQTAAAGEWRPGKNDHNGAPEHAHSWCVYNGHDDDDEEDDALWAATPSGGVVQSGGQMIAAQAQGVDLGLPPEEEAFPGIQGFACNPIRGGTPGD